MREAEAQGQTLLRDSSAHQSRSKRRRAERLLTLAGPLMVLVLWEAIVRVGLLDARFFPPPTQIVGTFVDMIASRELVDAVRISLVRLTIGFVMGAVPGIALGLLMGISRSIRALIRPLVAAIYPVPKTAILPLILLLVGVGELSQYLVVASGVFFIVVVNTLTGVVTIPRTYFDVGHVFGAARIRRFTTIALPGAVPNVLTGFQLGIGLGIALLVVGEMLNARSGLGFIIWQSWQTFDVARMFVGLVAVSILGFAIQMLLDMLERRLTPWAEA